MRIPAILLLTLMVGIRAAAQPVGFGWASSFTISDNGNFSEEAIATAPNGDVVAVGAFNLAVDMDPGPDTAMLTPSDPFPGDGFVLRLDAGGNYLWAVPMARSADQVAVNATGEVYVAGNYLDSMDLDPGPGTLRYNTGQVPAVYVVKLDVAGNLLWGRVIPCNGTTPEIVADALELAPDGDVVLACLFDGTADFGPLPEEGTLSSNGCFLCSETFMARFDADGNLVGKQQLRVTTGMANGAARIASMAFDTDGSLYATGYYNGVVDFDPGAGEYLDDGTVAGSYLLKLDALGAFAWMLPIGTDQLVTLNCLAIDPNDHDVAVSGYFQGTTDLDPGAGSSMHTATGDNDLCVVRFSAEGAFQWARQFTSENFESAHGLHIAGNGEVYVLGISSYGYLDLDPGPGDAPFTEDQSAFLSVLDASGDYQWSAGILALTSTINNVEMAVDAANNIHFTGRNARDVDFDPGPGTAFVDVEVNASFVAKWTSTGTGFQDEAPPAFQLYPNPSSGSITIVPPAGSPTSSFTITDALGRVVRPEQRINGANTFELEVAPGSYKVNMETPKGRSAVGIIIQ